MEPNKGWEGAQQFVRKSNTGNDVLTYRQGLAAKASDHNAINDKPITNVKDDKLGFAPFVYGLKEFIDSLDTQTPLTIGLNGTWGSGKTSLMNMLQTELKQRTPHGRLTARFRWLFNWTFGILMTVCGKGWAALLDIVGLKERATMIRYGLVFGSSITNMVPNEFEPQFKKYIDHLTGKDREDIPALSNLDPPLLVDDSDPAINKIIRFWARKSYLKVKMPPAQHYCVWFNAWKYSDQNEIWAALAHATLRQLGEQKSISGSIFIVVSQTLRNLIKLNTNPIKLFKNNILPVLVTGASVILAIADVVVSKISPSYAKYFNFGFISSSAGAFIISLMAVTIGLVRKVKAPLSMAFTEALKSPKYDYETKMGFIDTFDREYARIIDNSVTPSVCNHPGKLIVFIDDLDRCTPTQTVKVIEAINLFLDSKGCVFILGMDMEFVSASIESEYVRLADIMRQRSPEIVSPGALFLDKIIQVPLNLPRPNEEISNTLVRDMFRKQIPNVPVQKVGSPEQVGHNVAKSKRSVPLLSNSVITPAASELANGEIDLVDDQLAESLQEKVNFARKDIQDAIELGCGLFNENVRMIKRYVNVFRLQIYICNQKDLLSSGEQGITPNDLAVWVALQMKWSELPRQLASMPNNDKLIELLMEIESLLNNFKLSSTQSSDWKPGGLDSAHRLVENYKTATEGQRLGSYLEKWIEDREFLYCIKRLGQFWHKSKSIDLLLDLAQQTELKVHGTATASS